jgi:hypothetical protein
VKQEVITHRCKINVKHTDEAAEFAVSGAAANNPYLSTRQIESYSGMFKTSVHRILKCHKFHPYQVLLHQKLHGMIFKIVYSFVSGHSNNCILIKPFSFY